MKNVKLNFKAKRFWILLLLFIPVAILINVVWILFIYNDPYLIFENINKGILTLINYLVFLSMFVLVFFMNRYEPKEITIKGDVFSILYFPKYFIIKNFLSQDISRLRFELDGSKIFVYTIKGNNLLAIMRKNALNDKAWNWLTENLLHKE